MWITRRLRRLLLLAALSSMPDIAAAQEAVVLGTVVDRSEGVLPGVTIVAVHEATGNKFVGVTDLRGMFRLPVRLGAVKVTAELGHGNIAPHVGVGAEVDALRLQKRKPPVEDAFLHLEFGNAVAQQTPDAVGTFENGHFVSGSVELLGARQAGWT